MSVSNYIWWEWFTPRPYVAYSRMILKYSLFFAFILTGIVLGVLIWYELHAAGEEGERRDPKGALIGAIVGVVVLGVYWIHMYWMVLDSFWLPWALVLILWYGLTAGIKKWRLGFYLGAVAFFLLGGWWIVEYYVVELHFWNFAYWWW